MVCPTNILCCPYNNWVHKAHASSVVQALHNTYIIRQKQKFESLRFSCTLWLANFMLCVWRSCVQPWKDMIFYAVQCFRLSNSDWHCNLGYFCQSINQLDIAICCIKCHQQIKNQFNLQQIKNQFNLITSTTSRKCKKTLTQFLYDVSPPLIQFLWIFVLFCQTNNPITGILQFRWTVFIGVVLHTEGSTFTSSESFVVWKIKESECSHHLLYFYSFQGQHQCMSTSEKSAMVDVYTKIKPDSFKW